MLGLLIGISNVIAGRKKAATTYYYYFRGDNGELGIGYNNLLDD
jgi:hypothetical protein